MSDMVRTNRFLLKSRSENFTDSQNCVSETGAGNDFRLILSFVLELWK